MGQILENTQKSKHIFGIYDYKIYLKIYGAKNYQDIFGEIKNKDGRHVLVDEKLIIKV